LNVPLVSILIPCRNAGPHIAATLESAFAQTWPACEVVLVDDGSTDESLASARRFESRGLRIISQSNRGAAAARNAALRAARGAWIQFLDADDLLHPEKIARQMAAAADAPAGTVFTARWGRFTDDPTRVSYPPGNPLFADLAPGAFLQAWASHDCMMHPAAWLVSRALADAAGPWDERLSLNDDGEYFTRIVGAATAVRWCGDAVSFYRSGLADSLSAQRSRRHLDSAFRALRLITGHMLRLEDSAAMRRAAADLCQRFAYDYYPAAPDLVGTAEDLARDFGGSDLPPLGGRGFQLARRMLGWKAARRLQIACGRFPASTSRS